MPWLAGSSATSRPPASFSKAVIAATLIDRRGRRSCAAWPTPGQPWPRPKTLERMRAVWAHNMTFRLLRAVMPKYLRPISLKTRIQLLVSLLIIAGIWSLATVVATVLQADLEKMIAQQLSTTLGYVTNDIDQAIQFRFNALNKIAATISPEIQADPSRLQRLLEQSDLSMTLFPEGVSCTNSQGIIIAESPVLEGRLGGSLKDRDYFREAMAGRKQAIGGPLLGRFVKQPVVALAVPLHDALGATTGILAGTISLSDPELFDHVKMVTIGKTGYFLVASPKEHLIVSATDRKRILTPLPARGVNPLFDRRLDEGYEGAGISVTSQGQEVFSVSRNMQSADWIALLGIGTEEAFAPIVSLRRRIYLGALLLSLVAALILRAVLKRQLAPLEEAAVAMRRMSEGEMQLAQIPVVRSDEIGQLVGNFNRLVLERNRLDYDLREEIAERKRREDEVRNLNENLERRVLDRTDELLVANRALEKEIGERKITNQRLEEEIRERKTAESSALDFSARLQVMTRDYAGAEETERRRLARELHDRVSSSLTAIGLSLGLIERQLPQDAAATIRERLSSTAALVKDTLSVTREISHDLHPAVLEYGGILPALEDYGRKYSGCTGIAVEVKGIDRQIRLPPAKEIALYRIAQEALTNCAKYAEARTITIELDGDAKHATFVISDDGIGFDLLRLTDGKKAPGLGLLSMRERAEAIGGKLTLESAPGLGTRITVGI